MPNALSRREAFPSAVGPRSRVYTSLLQSSPAVGTPLPLCSDPSPMEKDEGQFPLAELPLPSTPVPSPPGQTQVPAARRALSPARRS